MIRQQTDLAGDLVILSFALGAGVPMLAIALTGRKLMGKLGFFVRYAEAVRKAFGVLILLSVAYIGAGVEAQSLFASASPQASPTPAAQSGPAPQNGPALQDGLSRPYAAPEFTGLANWINSPPLTMQRLKGKVVLVNFWTYSCINCIRTLPYLTGWDKKYRGQGLVIVGVHAPEFEFEKNLDNVRAAVAQYGIAYPVAQDNGFATWDNFKNSYWPAHYLIDRDGRVVYTHFGEGDYQVTENNIRYLLGLKPAKEGEAAEAPAAAVEETPETYLGYERADAYAGKTPVRPTP